METVFVGPAPRIAVSTCTATGRWSLFLHGIRGNRRNWTPPARRSSRGTGFKAAAWDARGYGESDDYEGALKFDALHGRCAARRAIISRQHKCTSSACRWADASRATSRCAIPTACARWCWPTPRPGFDALSADEVKQLRRGAQAPHARVDASAWSASRAPGRLRGAARELQRAREESYRRRWKRRSRRTAPRRSRTSACRRWSSPATRTRCIRRIAARHGAAHSRAPARRDAAAPAIFRTSSSPDDSTK